MYERPHGVQYVRQMRPRCLSEKLTLGPYLTASMSLWVQYVSIYRRSFTNKKSWLYNISPNNDKHIKAIENYHYILSIFPNLLYTKLGIIQGILSTPSSDGTKSLCKYKTFT